MGDDSELDAQFREIYDRYAGPIVFQLRKLRLTEAEAWDILQEALIRFLAVSRRRRKKIEHPYSYLMRSAFRLALRYLDRQVTRSREKQAFVSRRHSEPQDARLEAAEVLELIGARLDRRGRRVLEAMAVEGLNARGIARRSGVPRTAVQRRIAEIKKLARRMKMLWQRK